MLKKTLPLLLISLLLSAGSYIDNRKCDQILDKKAFQICFDYKAKGPLFVEYNLTREMLDQPSIKKRPRFYNEKNLPKKYRVNPGDYIYATASKHPTWSFDRGHLANDADFDYSYKTLLKTYSMANIIPQVPTVNRKTWLKAEKYERMVAFSKGEAHIINGVIYGDPDNFLVKKSIKEISKKKKNISKKYIRKMKKYDKKLREKRVLIPTAFWKAIIAPDFKKCFLYKNEPTNPQKDKLKNHAVECKQFGL